MYMYIGFYELTHQTTNIQSESSLKTACHSFKGMCSREYAAAMSRQYQCHLSIFQLDTKFKRTGYTTSHI